LEIQPVGCSNCTGNQLYEGFDKGGKMFFEHHKQPIATQAEFAQRMVRFGMLAAGIILFSLGIGIVGYHYLESLSWVDSLLNASMILGGMGPVNTLQTNAGKIFASFYALYSGIVLLASVGVLATPVFHRFMHRFHLELEDD
jgi:hypothetical protein